MRNIPKKKFLVILLCIVFTVLAGWIIGYFLAEHGHVTGEYKGGIYHSFDHDGHNPFTSITLANFTVEGNIEPVHDSSFRFGNAYEGLDSCIVDSVYKFSFHREHDYWVLDNIERVME